MELIDKILKERTLFSTKLEELSKIETLKPYSSRFEKADLTLFEKETQLEISLFSFAARFGLNLLEILSTEAEIDNLFLLNYELKKSKFELENSLNGLLSEFIILYQKTLSKSDSLKALSSIQTEVRALSESVKDQETKMPEVSQQKIESLLSQVKKFQRYNLPKLNKSLETLHQEKVK